MGYGDSWLVTVRVALAEAVKVVGLSVVFPRVPLVVDQLENAESSFGVAVIVCSTPLGITM